MRPSTQLSRSLWHYLVHSCADPSGRQSLLARRAISADLRLDPDTTVWASIDAGFGVRGDGEGVHNDDHIGSYARSRPTVTAGYEWDFRAPTTIPMVPFGAHATPTSIMRLEQAHPFFSDEPVLLPDSGGLDGLGRLGGTRRWLRWPSEPIP